MSKSGSAPTAAELATAIATAHSEVSRVSQQSRHSQTAPSECSRVSAVPTQLGEPVTGRPLEELLDAEDNHSVLSRLSELGVPSRPGPARK